MKSLSVTLLVLFSLTLMSCGETTQLLSMQATPLTPLVINQDFTDRSESTADNSVETVYRASWMRFKFQVKNKHSKVITIVGFRFTVINTVSKEEKIFNISIEQVIDGVTSGSKELMPDALLATEEVARFVYLDALPAEEGEVNASYNIKAEVQGWIGTSREPEGRLTSSYSFTTF